MSVIVTIDPFGDQIVVPMVPEMTVGQLIAETQSRISGLEKLSELTVTAMHLPRDTGAAGPLLAEADELGSVGIDSDGGDGERAVLVAATGPVCPARPHLFTPGPLSTSLRVKRLQLEDMGSRNLDFAASVANVRRMLLEVAASTSPSLEGAFADAYTSVIMQGSGTFAVESTLTTAIPRQAGKLLICVNGSYGERMAKICTVQGIPYTTLDTPFTERVDPAAVAEMLAADAAITHVAAVHCETTTGLLNDIEAIGQVVAAADRTFIVDAMSAFGATPLDFGAAKVGFLVTSANKCIQGVPGFGVVIAEKAALEACAGNARSYSLDLHDQYLRMEKDGQFRFTPPTVAIMAYEEALKELQEEGGVLARRERYRNNKRLLCEGMAKLGFSEYLPEELSEHIITAFLYPRDASFDFREFYERLLARGLAIYPGKVVGADSFRIGTIGYMYPRHIKALLAAMEEVIAEMGVTEF